MILQDHRATSIIQAKSIRIGQLKKKMAHFFKVCKLWWTYRKGHKKKTDLIASYLYACLVPRPLVYHMDRTLTERDMVYSVLMSCQCSFCNLKYLFEGQKFNTDIKMTEIFRLLLIT